jgi:putative DNA primase/helicase
MFDRVKYSTITGHRLDDAAFDVMPCQSALDALYARVFDAEAPEPFAAFRTTAAAPEPDSDDDEARLGKARTSRNGARFVRLHDVGDIGAYGNDRSRADQALCNDLAFWFDADPNRIDRRFRGSALMRPKWDEVHGGDGSTYGELTIAKAVASCPEPYRLSGPRPNLRVVPKQPSQIPPGSDDQPPGDGDDQPVADDAPESGFRHTDMGNAQRLAEKFGDDIRHSHEQNRWYVWDGTRYAEDRMGAIETRAKKTVRSIFAEAAKTDNDEKRSQLTKHGQKSEAAPRVAAMISLARSEPDIPIRVDDLDRDAMLLNVKNGTLDLRTGRLGGFDRSNLITKLAPVVYRPGATCPTFDAFLRRVLGDDDALVSFIQRAAGYSLTGSTVERMLLILFGEGKNGKSTLLEALRAVLGDYAMRTPTDTLLDKRDSGIPNDVARLRGVRFVSASEAEEGQRLAEAKIKDLTGGDTISARFMRSEFFDFMPTFKLWLSTNHKPIIRGTDEAIWDRVKLVPFLVRIPPEEQDKHLRAKLIAEASGILNWALQGCLEWQRDGLGEPKAVRDATKSYRAEMDVLGAFFDDRCVIGPDMKVTAKGLYLAYQRWCEDNGERQLSQIAMGKRLAERGFEPDRGGKDRTRIWVGIGLKVEPSTDSYEGRDDERNPLDRRTHLPGGRFGRIFSDPRYRGEVSRLCRISRPPVSACLECVRRRTYSGVK